MNYLTNKKISAQELSFERNFPDCGALCTFEGIVRNHHNGKSVKKMEYQAYEPMAEKELADLVVHIKNKWPMCKIDLIHRIGNLEVGDVAVAIVAWAPHRKEAFQACEATINRLKKTVPIWKKEFYSDGNEDWVICTHHGE